MHSIRPRRLAAAFGLWCGLAVLAILNAAVRETIVAPVVGAYWGHVASTITYITALLIVAAAYFGRYTTHSPRELAAIGGAWVTLTVLFEFGFGHYVVGTPWSTLLRDYDVTAGRVWAVVLLTLAIAPLAFGHWLRRGAAPAPDR